MEAADCDPSIDRARMQPELDELSTFDRPVLRVREPRDPRIDRTTKNFATHSVVNLFGFAHPGQPALPSVTALLPG